MCYVLVFNWGHSDHLHEAGQIDFRQVVYLVDVLENGKDEEKKPRRAATCLCNVTTPEVEQRLEAASTRVFYCQ